MRFSQAQTILLLCIINCFVNFNVCYPIPKSARDKGFVYLHEVDPTILVSLRYFSDEIL